MYYDAHHWNQVYAKSVLLPWRGIDGKFFKQLRKHIPQDSFVLDVGCGDGEKAIYFAHNGYSVYGFDLSKEAIVRAEARDGCPIYFVGDCVSFAPLVQQVKFHLILDILVSQFLSRKEQQRYVEQLAAVSIPGETILALKVFRDGLGWVNDIKQSPAAVEEIFGNSFKIIAYESKKNKEGYSIDSYLMRAYR